MYLVFVFFFFFFQAEDGIRDLTVTGVQTCALPICCERLTRRGFDAGPEIRPHVRLHLLHRRRSEEHTSELQSQSNLVCRLLLEKKKDTNPALRRGRADECRPRLVLRCRSCTATARR